MRELPEHTALVQASRSVGSPQIRNRGTVGGNLGTGSPAGDALPVLAAWDAEIVLARAGGSTRSVPWREFLTGVKQTAREPGELILGARMERASRPRLLLEDRDAERDGDRGREPLPAGRRGRAGRCVSRWAPSRPRSYGRERRRDRCGAGVRGRRSVGRPTRARWGPTRSNASASSWRRPRDPSTTSAGRARIVGTPSR